MPVATILFSWFGCTQMESPGEPFSPVDLSTSTIEEVKENPINEKPNEDKKIESDDEKDDEKVDPLFQTTGEVLITSGEKSEDQENKDLPTDGIVETDSKPLAEEVETANKSNTITESKEETDGNSVASINYSGIRDWPLHVVKTEAQLNPPRAILGLPSGDEVVVTPGKQLPDHGLVVMSIGSKGVVLAKVTPVGDHAKIESVTLPSLND